MSKNLISVIVPIYNVEQYLEKCIESIINQTYSNLEIILVDDGSVDNSGKICDKYKKIDSRIIVVHKSNGGLSSARNKGLEIAKGNLIGFVDSDDYLELNMYEELKKNMDKYDSDISMCNYYYEKKGKKVIKNISFNKEEFVSTKKDKYYNSKNEYNKVLLYAWNKLYKKEIFNNIRFPEGRIYEYSYIICDILSEAKKVSYTSMPLYNYVYRKSSIGNSFCVAHFDKIGSNNKKIEFFNKNRYYDLADKEKNYKMNNLIINLAKMKKYKIKNKEIWNKYYKELVDTSKEVKLRNATKINKLYKVFRRPFITLLSFMIRIRDLIK